MTFDEYSEKKKKKYASFSEYSDSKHTAIAPTNLVTSNDDIAPVVTAKDEEDEKKWFKSSAGNLPLSVISTVGDVGVNVVKGASGLVEGVTDLILYGVAGVQDLAGFDEEAKYLKEEAAKSQTDALFGGLEKAVDKNSFFGDKADNVSQALGQIAAIVLTGGVAGAAGASTAGVSAITTGLMGASSMGSGMGEAYQSDATDEEALKYGVAKGVIDAGTELIFGGLGKSVKALGISKGLTSVDDMFAKKLGNVITKNMSNEAFKRGLKNTVEYSVKAGAEGAEELIAGYLTAHAKKATFTSEEDFDKILQDENLLEQFVVGAITSGIAQSGDFVKSTKQGRDFVSNLTTNEETVVEAEYQNRLAEEEADGKKLSNKEKNKIYERVVEDLKKGYISTDTIESALGGDTYKNYKSSSDEEAAQIKELENQLKELENAPNTVGNAHKYDTIQKQLEELKANSKTSELKTQLSEEVQKQLVRQTGKNGKNIQADNYLIESYNERAKRGQAFEADLSQYDEKLKTTVQKAVDSGVLNNTRRTHELVDMIAKISADKGVLFDFTNNKKLKESSFAVDGATVNGYYDKSTNTVGLNIDSQKYLNSVVGHEITHVLEGTEIYTELQNAAFEYARAKGEYDSRREALAKLYAEEDIDAEMTSDLVGDYLFSDADFVNTLSTKHRNIFQKIYDEIKYLLKITTAGSKEARELEKVKRAFDKAYREGGKANTEINSEDIAEADTKYSISVTDQKTIDFLENQEHITTYKAMQLIDGKLYPPMAAKVKDKAGKYRLNNPSELGKWQQATEDPTHIKKVKNGVGYYTLNKGNGKSIDAAYNPYEHSSNLVLNDQFEEAYNRDNIVTVECEIPVSEMTSGYKAEYAKDGTGVMDWKSGVVAGKIKDNKRKVYLSRYLKPVRILSDAETATMYKDVVGDVSVPFNVVTPNLLTELEKAGVNIDYDGSPMYQSIQRRKAQKADTKYSLSTDSEGAKLTKEQSEYFKNSKMRDENGNLKVMYHGSQDAGFHTFDANMSDDNTSFFFVDRNDVAASYSGTTETYEAQTIRTAEDMNNFIESIGVEGYEVVEKDGKFTLLYEGDRVADSNTAQGIYDEFCWYEGVGEGDANYKVYLNLKNPLEVDAEGRNWNNVTREFSQEISDKYNSLTAEERAALTSLASWEDVSIFRDEIRQALADTETGAKGSYDEAFAWNIRRAYEKLGGNRVNMYDLFTIASDNFSEDSIKEFAVKQMNTRDYAQKAKAEGYDGVIFKNIVDVGGYGNGSEGASTVAIAFDSNQIKSVANNKPTANPDIRYSLSEDSEGRKLSDEQAKYFDGSKVVDDNGKLKVVYHGSPADFNTFSLEYLGTNGTAEGYGFYFTDSKRIAEGYSKGREGQQNGNTGRLFEVYLDIKKPLSDTEVTMSRSDFKKLLIELNNQVDEDGEPLEFLANYGDVEWEGLNKVLNYAMEIEYDGSDSDVNMVHSIINSCGNKELVFDLLRKVTGYDGIIVNEATWGGDQTIYIAFHPEQIKNIDNLNPTTNPDIRYSLSANGEMPKTYGNFNISGEDVRIEAAPTQEDIAPVEEAAPVNETTSSEMEQVAPAIEATPMTEEETQALTGDEPTLYDLERESKSLEEQLSKAVAAKDAETVNRLLPQYNDLQEKIKQIQTEENALNSERLASLDDADMPPEVEAPYYEENNAVTPDSPFENRDIKAVGNRKVKAYMYENPEVKPFFQEEARAMLGELMNTTKGERWYNDELYYESGGESGWSGTQRKTTPDIAYLLDELKYSYAEIEKGLKAIIEDNGAENNACSKRIEFLLNDRLMKGYVDDAFGFEVPPNQDYIRLLNEKQINEYNEEAKRKFFDVADDYAPYVEGEKKTAKATAEPIANEDIAPVFVTKRKGENEGQLTLFEETEAEAESPKVAKVMTSEPETPKKKRSIFNKGMTNIADKGFVFEKLAKKTKNRELESKYNFMRYSESRAQEYIAKHLNPIVDKVEKLGKTEQLYEYAYHLHNIDRMSLETEENRVKRETLRKQFKGYSDKQIESIAMEWFKKNTPEDVAKRIKAAREYIDTLKGRNKPVFDDSVTADVSREAVKKLEAENPELKELSDALVEYNTRLRKMLVDGNVISQETADLWAKMYPHYVPIRRADYEGLAINVPLDTNKTGVNAPIKRATGGNSDILPLFNTMAMRTEQTFKAIAKNSFGVELMHTLDSVVENENANLDEVIDSFDKHDELLQKGKDGKNPTFTVFEDGKRVTFEITEDMYDALKPTSDGLAYTNKVANTVGNIFRGLLTEYNPVFMLTNAVKDAQDVLINSQHATKTYSNIPKAIKEMATNGKWYTEYMENGGSQNTYFDSDSKTFKKENLGWKKIVGMPLRAISKANNSIDRVPRLAEYIASREAGASIETSMLDAARVSTNFAAGGDVTKALNRNGFTFLNASVQGAMQQVRNVQEAKMNGFKGWVQLAAKVAVAGLPALLLNDLLWDDDEEYEELSDYVKQNYYVVAKLDDGKFVRIPKGRTVAVIQEAFTQMENLATGNDEVDLGRFTELVISNLAPNNPLENNILAPFIQVANNETWYGEDLVPMRLQDLPEAEQYDESTDAISKWLGENLNISPYKLNYLLNQYSGGIGDVFLPMMTPEAESGDNSLAGNILAPFKDKFTTDSVMNNQNVSDFYGTMDELTQNANSMYATDEDVLKSKYLNSVNAELSELYAQKREIQNSNLSDDVKYNRVRNIQMQIDTLAKESLNTYNSVNINNGYATVGDRHYRLNKEGEWEKISDKQLEKQNEVTGGLGISASDYWSNKEEYDYAYDYPEKYAVAKTVGGYSAYKTYSSELYDIKADKDEDGKSISGSRKEKVIDYINNLNADYGEKIILFKSEYNADDTYNYEIIDYLNSREDISYEEMVTILKELGFTVHSDGTVTW